MNEFTRSHGQKGFTLVELMVVIAIISILVAISVPLFKAYRIRAQYISLRATLSYIMDGLETYYIENDKFYPAGQSGYLSVAKGQKKNIPEIKYTFPSGHDHRFDFYSLNFNFPNLLKLNFAYIYVYADFDKDGNGANDIYLVYMFLYNNVPYKAGSITYYRYLMQLQ